MNNEERSAIVSVVKNRQSILKDSSEQSVLCQREDSIQVDDSGLDEDDLPLSALTPETTLQEDIPENKPKDDLSVSPPKAKDAGEVFFHHCDQCNKSFKLKIQLNRHMKSHQDEDDGGPPGKKVKIDQSVDPNEVLEKMKEK